MPSRPSSHGQSSAASFKFDALSQADANGGSAAASTAASVNDPFPKPLPPNKRLIGSVRVKAESEMLQQRSSGGPMARQTNMMASSSGLNRTGKFGSVVGGSAVRGMVNAGVNGGRRTYKAASGSGMSKATAEKVTDTHHAYFTGSLGFISCDIDEESKIQSVACGCSKAILLVFDFP